MFGITSRAQDSVTGINSLVVHHYKSVWPVLLLTMMMTMPHQFSCCDNLTSPAAATARVRACARPSLTVTVHCRVVVHCACPRTRYFRPQLVARSRRSAFSRRQTLLVPSPLRVQVSENQHIRLSLCQ